MAYRVGWIIQDRVLDIRLVDEITLNDFRGLSIEVADLMDAAYASQTSGIIVGVVDLTTARFGALLRSAVSAAQEISSVIDERLWKAKAGFIVLITVSDIAKVLTSAIIRISRQPLTTVGSRDEALTVVSYMYPEMQAQLDAYRAAPSADKTTQ